MNEKLQYADMLDIPVNTTNITYKPIKKKRTKKKSTPIEEDVKNQLLAKVNGEEEQKTQQQDLPTEQENLQFPQVVEQAKPTKTKKSFKFSIISLQLVIIGVLLAVILVTNTVYANSGINTFLRGVFSPNSATITTDERVYLEFKPTFSLDDDTMASIAENGNMTIAGEGSAYSPCDGKVTNITALENGEYSVEIAHSENFSSIISGLTFCYLKAGDKVLSRVPVGYSAEKEFSICFLNSEGAVVTGYQLVDNQVVWGV